MNARFGRGRWEVNFHLRKRDCWWSAGKTSEEQARIGWRTHYVSRHYFYCLHFPEAFPLPSILSTFRILHDLIEMSKTCGLTQTLDKFPIERKTKVTFPEEIWRDNKYSCVKGFCVHVFLSLLHNKTNTASTFFSFIASVVAPADLHHCEFLKHLLPSILNHWRRRITDRKEERWRCIFTQRMQQLPGKALNVQNDKRSMCKKMGWTGERCGKDVLPYTETISHHPPCQCQITTHYKTLPEYLKNNRWKREWFYC